MALCAKGEPISNSAPPASPTGPRPHPALPRPNTARAAPPRPCPTRSPPLASVADAVPAGEVIVYTIDVTPVTTNSYDYPKGGWSYYEFTIPANSERHKCT